MAKGSQFIADLLQRSASGYAALAAQSMLERESDGPHGVAQGFEHLRRNLAGRLNDLAAAVAQEDPRVYADQIAWSRAAYLARGVAVEELKVTQECLKEVLQRELPGMAREPVLRCLERGIAVLDESTEQATSHLVVDTVPGELAARYLEALLRGDCRRGRTLILEAVEAGRVSVEDALVEVCLVAEREVGRLWHLNEVSIAEEHFVSATTRDVIAQLLGAASPAPSNGLTVITCAASGDLHDIGLRVTADLFELDGWRAIHLGADVPEEDLAQVASQFGADLIVLSATLAAQRVQVRQAIDQIRTVLAAATPPAQVRVLVGGRAFEAADGWAERVGADGHAGRITDVVRVGRRLLGLS